MIGPKKCTVQSIAAPPGVPITCSQEYQRPYKKFSKAFYLFDGLKMCLYFIKCFPKLDGKLSGSLPRVTGIFPSKDFPTFPESFPEYTGNIFLHSFKKFDLQVWNICILCCVIVTPIYVLFDFPFREIWEISLIVCLAETIKKYSVKTIICYISLQYLYKLCYYKNFFLSTR